jgi:osmoprotectant transport system substrate-binding protein
MEEYVRTIRSVLVSTTAMLLLVVIGGCGASEDPLATDSSDGGITVGSANFPEAILLGEIYAQALEANGVEVERSLNIGAREAYIKAIRDESVNLLPEYTGNLLLHFIGSSSESDPQKVYANLTRALPQELRVLQMSRAVDEDALVVRHETAQRYNLDAIPDLARVDQKLVVGGSPEFRQRQAGLRGLQNVYNLDFKAFRTLDAAGPLSVEALSSGDVDVTNLFTTQSAITTNDFVVLEDPRNISIPQNVVPLIRRDATTPKIADTLNQVSAVLTTPELADMVERLEVDHDSPESVASDFIDRHGLG